MSIENQLSQLIESNQALVEVNRQLLTALQSGATFQQVAEPAKRTRRTKAEIAADEAATAAAVDPAPAVADGDPVGTSYYVNDHTNQVFKVLPGQSAPERFSAQVTAEIYLAKKAEFAGKEAKAQTAEPVTTASQPAATEPSATAPAATASVETSTPTNTPTWDEVVKQLKDLAADPAHGGTAVREIMKKVAPDATTVPQMKGKGLESALLAEINARRNPVAAEADLF